MFNLELIPLYLGILGLLTAYVLYKFILTFPAGEGKIIEIKETTVFLDAGDGIFKDNPWPIFAFFAGMMALQLIWVFVKVPETKGVSLEKLEEDLVKP